MSPLRWRAGPLWISVAAGFLAATLAATACGERVGSGGRVAEAENADEVAETKPAALRFRWLIAPDAALDPPLAAPIDIAADERSGRLLIMESQPPELRVHSMTDGGLMYVLGREGDGPGEYRHPISVAVNLDGIAAVLSVSGRVTFWDRDGGLAGGVQVGRGLASDIMAARGDTFYVKSDLFPPEDISEYWLVTPDAATANPRYRDADLIAKSEPGGRLKNHAYAVAATPRGELLLSPPGKTYLIQRVGSDGKKRQVIRRPEIGALKRSADEIEAVRERVRKAFKAAGRAGPAFLPVPEYRSHLAQLAVAPDGSIWALTQRGDSAVSVVDCFAPDGRFVAAYSIRLRVSDIAVTSESLYLLARATLDVPGVAVVPRLERVRVDGSAR